MPNPEQRALERAAWHNGRAPAKRIESLCNAYHARLRGNARFTAQQLAQIRTAAPGAVSSHGYVYTLAKSSLSEQLTAKLRPRGV